MAFRRDFCGVKWLKIALYFWLVLDCIKTGYREVVMTWYRNYDEFSSDEKGASMVESAIALPIFITLIFMSVDVFLLSYRILSVQFISSRVAREAVIGPSILPASTSAPDFIKNKIHTMGQTFFTPVDKANVNVCEATEVTSGVCTVTNAGGPGELIAVTVNQPASTVFLGSFNLKAIQYVRNENW